MDRQRLNNGMLPDWLREMLARQQALVVAVHEQLQMLTKQLEAAAPEARTAVPKPGTVGKGRIPRRRRWNLAV